MPNPFKVIREELPKFLDEPQAEGFKGVLSTILPKDASDIGLTIAGGPFGRAIKLGGLALAGATYAPEAEAANFSGGLSKLLKFLRQTGKGSLDSSVKTRDLQQRARMTGNEHMWPGLTDEILTSGRRDRVTIPEHIVRSMQVNRSKLQVHNHPRGTSAAPSDLDLELSKATPRTGALIITPEANPRFTYYKSNDPQRVNPDELMRYADWVRQHRNDSRALGWAEEVGLTDGSQIGNEFGNFSQFLDANDTLFALRDAELRGKLQSFYNTGNVRLPDIDAEMPGGQLIDEFYDEVLRR